MTEKLAAFSDDEIRAEFQRRGLRAEGCACGCGLPPSPPGERVRIRACWVTPGKNRIGRGADPETRTTRLLGEVDAEKISRAEIADGSTLIDHRPEKTVIECATGLLVIEIARNGKTTTYRAGITQGVKGDEIRWQTDVKHVSAEVIQDPHNHRVVGYVHIVQVGNVKRQYRALP